MKTKIIWLIDGLGPGGAEQLMTTLLSCFDTERYEMRVCALQDRGSNLITERLEQLNIPVDFVSIKRLRNPSNVFRILAYLRKHKPDIVHTQLEFSDVLGNIAAKLLNILSVSTVHTIEAPRFGTRAFWRQQVRWFALRNFCTRIIAVSDKTRAHHIQQGKFSQDKIITIYNGIDFEKFESPNLPNIDRTRKNLALSNTGPIICTVAVLREQKGIQYMIDALPAILEHFPDAVYLVVGDGKYGPILKSLADSRGVGEHVTFAGHRTDIPEMLAMSDIFVLPTLGDALPTVLIEAMAARKPIVASNVGGVPEIITDEVTGLLVPSADSSMLANACLQILKDDDLAKELALTAYQVAQEKFTVLSQVEQLNELYQALQGNRE